MKTKENERENKFYKTNPSGISLIVLVITIIVIIILATAIIVTLLSNNPINEANKARYENDRDSMQVIFTNTVAKVMAQKQGTMEIEASALNTVTSGVSSATGDANYTLNGVTTEENKNGRIIFDNKENTETEYYTGKQLPIYNSGETTWYVDEEGIITLQVGDKIYGNGETEKLNKNIQIESKVTPSSDYVKATIEIEITYEGEIESITINGESIEIPEKQDGKYIISKEVTENGEYKVEVKAKDGTKNKEIVKVEELTEDMEIWNREDMESFRDKVNSGRTFETKKATVMADIDLQGSETNKWTPIVKEFLGTFEGNNHKIKNLYISSNSYENLGLFSTIGNEAIVQNTILENVYINNTLNDIKKTSLAGGIAGKANGKIINCGINSGSISASKTVVSYGPIYSSLYIGGIAGRTNNTISGCYNKATVNARNSNAVYNTAGIGGISGCSSKEILNCYNTGSLSGVSGHLMLGGIVGEMIYNNSMYNSYNIGSVTGSASNERFMGGLAGRIGYAPSTNFAATIENSYCLNTASYSYVYWYNSYRNETKQRINASTLKSYASTLGNAFIQDTKNINDGYPVLKWQVSN